MADSSWNTPAPTRPGRRGRTLLSWLVVPLALAAGAAILVFALVGRATGLRRQAWPLIQAVQARLSTDEGARDLFRKNPGFAAGYESEEAFLEAARAWRTRGGSLPPREPEEDPRAYTVSSDPFSLGIAIRGSGGGWMRARFATGPEAGRDAGEGLMQLVFADSFRGLQDSARDARRQVRARQYAAFLADARSLGTDEGARDLYRREAGLRRAWPSEAAFLQDARAWRPHLAALPEDLRGAERGGPVQAAFRRHNSPLGQSQALEVAHPGGVWKAAWRDGALADLRHEAR